MSIPSLDSSRNQNPPALLRPRRVAASLARGLVNSIGALAALPFDLNTPDVFRPKSPLVAPNSFLALPRSVRRELIYEAERSRGIGFGQPSTPESPPVLVARFGMNDEVRNALRNDLKRWVRRTFDPVEQRERASVAAAIISCFHHQTTRLVINAGHITELPVGIGFLHHVRELCLSGCESLRAIPNVLHFIPWLEHLDVTDCRSLSILPPSALAILPHGRVILRGSGVNIADPLGSLHGAVLLP